MRGGSLDSGEKKDAADIITLNQVNPVYVCRDDGCGFINSLRAFGRTNKL